MACVGDVLTIPRSARHSVNTLYDGHRYATFAFGDRAVLNRASCWRRNHAGDMATVGGHVAGMVAKSTACVHERQRVPGRLQRQSERFVEFSGQLLVVELTNPMGMYQGCL